MKDNPSLSDAFVGMDYEIKPKMIEVWNGKRIAWAIALLSVLILIPIIYLLYNSYWNESRQQSQMTAENTPQSRLESATTDSPVVITAPKSVAKSDASPSQPVIDNEARARLEQRSLEEVSASIHKPLTETGKTSETSTKETGALSANAKPTTEISKPKPQSESIATAAKKELRLQTEQVSTNTNTSTSSTTTSPPPAQASAQQTTDSLQSEQVNRTNQANTNAGLSDQQLKPAAKQLSADTNSVPQAVPPQVVENKVNQQQTNKDLQSEKINSVDQARLNDNLNKQQLESQTEQPSSVTDTAEADRLLDDNYNDKSEHVNRARLVSAVSKLEPVGEDLQSITLNNGQSRRIVYFTEVKGLGGQNITYRWLHEGQLVFSKKIAVDGDYSWRSYINKLIPASMPGSWVVELRDDQDIILSQHSFEVLQSLE
jgi:hypothetical protein